MFTIKILTDNAAFDGPANCEAEISRILRSIAEQIRRYGLDFQTMAPVIDVNGNNVGEWGIES